MISCECRRLCHITSLHVPAAFTMTCPALRLLRPCLAVLLLAAACIASADELGEIQRLQANGQTAAALQRTERALAAKPKDTQLRFMQGVLLAESHRDAEAIAQFEQLTQQYPELAEPYNNLAALYAAAGDYERAQSALEQALRANPSLATAQANLGDVHAMLASRAYARALQMDPNNPTLPAKLATLRQMLAPKPTSAPAR
jgi:tetratricopeptide (TPR) repeat protein